jgi:hypothetical protein
MERFCLGGSRVMEVPRYSLASPAFFAIAEAEPRRIFLVSGEEAWKLQEAE